MCKTFKDGRAPGAISRLAGEKWADFDLRQREHRAANTVAKPKRKRNPAREALTRAVNKAIARGAPIYTNEE